MTVHAVETTLHGLAGSPFPTAWSWSPSEPLLIGLRVWTRHGPACWVLPRSVLADGLWAGGVEDEGRFAVATDWPARLLMLRVPTVAGEWNLSGCPFAVGGLVTWSMTQVSDGQAVDAAWAAWRAAR